MKKLYLPVIGNGPVVAPQAHDPARELFAFMKEHPDQKRLMLNWSPLLAFVAEFRCKDMAERGYFDHVDPDGKGPNWHCREFGYRLPSHYHPKDKSGNPIDDINTIESIAAYGSPSDVWTVLMDSPEHRTHLLALDKFYQAQMNVGVGFVEVEGSRWGKYYCILSAPPESSA